MTQKTKKEALRWMRKGLNSVEKNLEMMNSWKLSMSCARIITIRSKFFHFKSTVSITFPT